MTIEKFTIWKNEPLKKGYWKNINVENFENVTVGKFKNIAIRNLKYNCCEWIKKY